MEHISKQYGSNFRENIFEEIKEGVVSSEWIPMNRLSSWNHFLVDEQAQDRGWSLSADGLSNDNRILSAGKHSVGEGNITVTIGTGQWIDRNWNKDLRSYPHSAVDCVQALFNMMSSNEAKLDKLGSTMDIHNASSTGEHQYLADKMSENHKLLQKLEKDNASLRELVDVEYRAEKLRTMSALTFLVCLISIISAQFYNIIIVHPIIAAMGILSSLGFLFLSHWRIRKNHDS